MFKNDSPIHPQPFPNSIPDAKCVRADKITPIASNSVAIFVSFAKRFLRQAFLKYTPIPCQATAYYIYLDLEPWILPWIFSLQNFRPFKPITIDVVVDVPTNEKPLEAREVQISYAKVV